MVALPADGSFIRILECKTFNVFIRNARTSWSHSLRSESKVKDKVRMRSFHRWQAEMAQELEDDLFSLKSFGDIGQGLINLAESPSLSFTANKTPLPFRDLWSGEASEIFKQQIFCLVVAVYCPYGHTGFRLGQSLIFSDEV